PSFAETRTPKPNCGLRTARTAGDLMVGNALGSEKDDLGSLHVTLGNGAAPGPSLEVDALLVRDLERGCRPIGHLTIVRSFCRICKLIVSHDTSRPDVRRALPSDLVDPPRHPRSRHRAAGVLRGGLAHRQVPARRVAGPATLC